MDMDFKNQDIQDHALDAFLDFLSVERGLSPNTIEAYFLDTRDFLRFLTDRRITYKEVSRDTINEFLQFLYIDKSPRSVGRKIVTLRTFYRFLLQDGYVDHDPTETLESPKTWQTLPRYLNQDEVENLLKQPKSEKTLGLRDRTMLEVLYATGLRVTELVSIKARDINLEIGVIRTVGKGNKERFVPLGDTAKSFIEKYRELAYPKLKKKESFQSLLLHLTKRDSAQQAAFLAPCKKIWQAGRDQESSEPSCTAAQLCHTSPGKWG